MTKDQGKIKKTRVKERRIDDAWNLVKLWRQVQNIKQGKKRKFTLDDSAKSLGIPRKTLEDYYYVFRRAHKLHIDFQAMHDQKMGRLRRLVKQMISDLENEKCREISNTQFEDVLFMKYCYLEQTEQELPTPITNPVIYSPVWIPSHKTFTEENFMLTEDEVDKYFVTD